MRLLVRLQKAALSPTGRTLLAGALLAAIPHLAFAQAAGGGGDVATIMENVETYLTGPLLTALAVIALVIVGFSMMALHFSMRTTAFVVVGLAIAFSARTLVTTFTG